MSSNGKFRYKHDPKQYPNSLVFKEVTTHRDVVGEYVKELSMSSFEDANMFKPDINLISQQPQLTLDLRSPLLDFLFKVFIKTRICSHLFYRSVRLLDRYCSKRIVLVDQAQLVASTCLWIVAKVDGGCSHCLSSSSCPIGGRFEGPTKRARIPRLTELCQLCGPSCNYDEGMFIQMERHILDTLSWSVTEPGIDEWIMDVDSSQNMANFLPLDKEAAISLKEFMINCTLYNPELISNHPALVAASINDIYDKLQSQGQSQGRRLMSQQSKQSTLYTTTPSHQIASLNPNLPLLSPQTHTSSHPKLEEPAINKNTTITVLQCIVDATETLVSTYCAHSPVKEFQKMAQMQLVSLKSRQFSAHSPFSLTGQEEDIFSEDTYWESGDESFDSIFEPPTMKFKNHSLSSVSSSPTEHHSPTISITKPWISQSPRKSPTLSQVASRYRKVS
ncbi:hypothetical protein LJB42_001666 [Komagataella kurtzmanii]|nr:hypothetical protein LJB42_001666 [Komagataella kurtzmanii]